MQILLKELIPNADPDKNPLRVQIYVDMDGVLVDMDKGFKALSGGYTPENFRDKYHGDIKVAKHEFWKLIGSKKDFWISLSPMPDATVLWKFVTENFSSPAPVVMSAGIGAAITQQKTEWIHRHIAPGVRVIICPGGTKKPEYLVKFPVAPNQYVTHVLIDDTQKNVDVWNNEALHRIAILHHSAAETIRALEPFIAK
jgi:hypothetical protein